MGKVTYFIEYYIPKTVKAQLSPYLPFWRVRGVRGQEGGKRLGGKGFFYLNREGEIRGKGGRFDQ